MHCHFENSASAENRNDNTESLNDSSAGMRIEGLSKIADPDLRARLLQAAPSDEVQVILKLTIGDNLPQEHWKKHLAPLLSPSEVNAVDQAGYELQVRCKAENLISALGNYWLNSVRPTPPR